MLSLSARAPGLALPPHVKGPIPEGIQGQIGQLDLVGGFPAHGRGL